MAKSTPKIKAREPQNALTKPLTADFKALFKALAKGVSHGAIGKWEEIGNDAVEAMASLGLATEPGELGFLLIQRSLAKALVELVGESAAQLLSDKNVDVLVEDDLGLSKAEIFIDRKFFDDPSALPVIAELKPILQSWLQARGLAESAAGSISARLPSYFVYALSQEWRRNAKSYHPIVEAIDIPFTRAGDREWAWSAYGALLKRRTQESVFEEPFSLEQLFVQPNAYYLEEVVGAECTVGHRRGQDHPRVVVSLQKELDKWLRNADQRDTIRVVSGGPGSGKSSFARIFASRIGPSRNTQGSVHPASLN